MTGKLEPTFFTNDITPLLWLAIPLILTGLVESSIGFFSTIFLAQLGAREIAAGALVSWLFGTLMVIIWGTLTSVSVSISQKHGAKDNHAVSKILRDGLLLAFVLVPPTFLILWKMAPVYLYLGQSEAIVVLAQSYLHGLAWGVFPNLMTVVLCQFLIGIGHVRTSLIFTMLWVPIAISCIYACMFGKLGLPAMDMAGIGWGMTASFWITTSGLIIYLLLHPAYKEYLLKAFSIEPPCYIRELIQIGLPMGAMYCIEVGFFFVVTILMGWQGEQQLAANQVVMQYLGVVISVIFAIAQAVSVRMGHKIGEKNLPAANNTSKAGVMISATFMFIVALFYWFLPYHLIAIDFNLADPKNAEVIRYTRNYFLIAAVVQIAEGIRITLFGSLRALHDTQFTLITSIITFWLIALPIGYGLLHTSVGSIGLWYGMVVGATAGSFILSYRFKKKMKHSYYMASLSRSSKE